jgi:NADH:ubiquinone oxidoreductase subunit 5 (subunit L)/multisubunit Na+/H+ antiporter MnhA subunit
LAFLYLGSPSGPRKTYENTEEQSLGIIVPIVLLSLLAIIFGYFAKESIVGVGLSVGGSSLTEMGVSYKPLYLIEADFGLSLLVKNFPFIATITGIFLGIVFFIIPSVRKNLVIGNKNSKESKNYFISSLDNTKEISNFGTLSEVSEIKLDYNSSILIHAFTNK